MDRPERLERPGVPLGAGTQSTGRGLPENPAQNRQMSGSSNGIVPPPVPAGLVASTGNINFANIPIPPPPPPPPPMLNIRGIGSSLTASAPIAASQVIALTREAMKEALRHTDQQAGDGSDMNGELKLGLTIDLSRKNIQKLPDEVVDIVMNKLERLALSHNKLSGFPARFAECSSLRYLNVRNNDIREFPLPLCDLRSLEILDLGRNKLRVLPPEIVKLSSLKVFALQRNRIEELPLCLADMSSIQMLKLDGNPIRFPPPEVFQVQASSPTNEGYLKDSEVTEVTVTSHVRKFLKMAMLNGRAEAAAAATASAASLFYNGPSSGPSSGGAPGSGSGVNGMVLNPMGGASDTPTDDSSDQLEPPRLLPAKRVTSGRFPIKVNGTEVGDLRSPGQRPPPIPTRSHYRGLSQQNTAVRRPGVMPLTISNVNERVRSNSETTLLPAPRGDRPGDRSGERNRRMGIVSKKAQELGTLDEIEANNRFSHYRGLSHGSAMRGNSNGSATIAADVKSPASPMSELAMQRPNYVRRLSILPERRRESKFCDPVIETAKGVLYSVFQIHFMIQMLMGLANDGTKRRSSLEIVFYNTNSHVEQLEREIQRYEIAVESGESGNLENENVHRACITLLHAYDHICSLLKVNVDLFLDNGDPRYVRTLLLQLYHSIMELRVASAGTITTQGYRKPASSSSTDRLAAASNAVSVGDTIKPALPPAMPPSRDASVMSTPTAERPGLTTVRGTRGNSVSHNPSNLRVSTDVPMPGAMPYVSGTGRTATITSATPRSGESFASTSSRGALISDITEEDRLFEKIFLSLQKSTDVALRLLPSLNNQYAASLRAAMAQRAPEQVTRDWRILLGRCATAIQQTEILKSRLSNIKLKEPGVRWQDSYWSLCVNFFDAWYSFADMIRNDKIAIQMPADTRARLRPLHQCIKDTTRLILQSPWSFTLRQSSMLASAMSPLSGGSTGSVLSGGSGGNQMVQLPMTPQSAALGPAVQATVPSTPQSASFANVFAGNVFERADTLISSGGISMSRTNTFSSTSGSSGLNSISSTLSVHADGSMTPSTMLSPGPLGPLPFRLNNGSKLAY